MIVLIILHWLRRSSALCSVLPDALSQHQMLHQLFLRDSPQQPFKQFLPNPAQGPFRRLSETYFFLRMRQARNLLQILKEGAPGKGKSLALARGSRTYAESEQSVLAVRRPVGSERQEHLPTSWSKGLVAKRGISTACRGVRRDSPSTPRESGCDERKKTPRAKTVTDTNSAGYATVPRLTDPLQPRQRLRRRRQQRRSRKGPSAWSLSGIWATSALPDQNLPKTWPTKIGPTKGPPLSDPSFD